MMRGVQIVALGARTPIGFSAEASAAAQRAGISRIAEDPLFVDAEGEKLRFARDGGLDPALLGVPRLAALATHALREVIAKLTAASPYAGDVRVSLALPEERPGFSKQDATALVRELNRQPYARVGSVRVERSGEGHAGALLAIERACDRISRDEADVIVVGGVETYRDADALDWLESDRRLARAAIRSGFPPGEGAAMLVLAGTSARKQLNLPALCTIRAAATTTETRDPNHGPGLLGEALTEVLRKVGADGTEPSFIHDVYCDINGERPRTTDWGFALLRVGPSFRDGSAYVSSVRECGDLGAATGAFNCVLASRAWQRGYARGARALVYGSSWQGLRGAVVLEQA
jgi:3-oxoacyl-[acyl-carrier-protein] synthase-1